MKKLTVQQILFIHSRLLAETGGKQGIRDLDILKSAIARPWMTFDANDLYADIYQKTAALMDSLVNNHPFIDGNKRVGIAAAGLFLQMNGYKLTCTPKEMEDFTLLVASIHLSIPEMLIWFQEHTKPTIS